ncbi:MAG: hypothetical protein Q9182_000841 [Xanthomendoza sp. 2 TL-2023]
MLHIFKSVSTTWNAANHSAVVGGRQMLPSQLTRYDLAVRARRLPLPRAVVPMVGAAMVNDPALLTAGHANSRVDVCIRVAAAHECKIACGANDTPQSLDSLDKRGACEESPKSTYKSTNTQFQGKQTSSGDASADGSNHGTSEPLNNGQSPDEKTGCQDACCGNAIDNTSNLTSINQDDCNANGTGVDFASLTFGKGEKDDCCESNGRNHGQACGSHLEAAFEKYASYLRLGRCICRSVLAPIETCCSKARRERAMTRESHKLARDSKTLTKETNVQKAECTGKSTSMSANQIDTPSVKSRRKKPIALRSGDIEMGHVDQTTQVSITISGMTCTGCVKKGINVFSRIPGVTDASINFVASSGEFKLDSQSDPAVVISKFEQETGFKCARVMKSLQTLDLVMSKAEAKHFESTLLAGIEFLSTVDKKTQCVRYDPTVIGARTVLASVHSGRLAAPRNDSALASGKKRLVQMAWSTALAAAFTIPVVVLAWSNNTIPYSKRSIISLGLATCVQVIAIPEFYVGALKALIFSKVIEMDMLVVISVTAAYGYSVIAFALVHRGYVLEQGEFFETSTLLVTLVLLGRLISVMARVKAFTAVSIKSLQAATALLVDQSGQTAELDARLLQYGDTILVPPHTKIVTDGEVVDGASEVDESMITGESSPVAKNVKDSVVAGTMNGPSPLRIRLTRLPGQNSITDIAGLVENALGNKPRAQDLADKVAGWFVPAVVGISCIVFAIWVTIGFQIRNQGAGGSIGVAITYGIAVLAISCPCALGLAVPLVLIIAGGVTAKSGVVIKNASATERAYRTTDVVFDKTGTLTTGVLEVIVERYFSQSFALAQVKAMVLALLKDNGHSVSSAVVKFLSTQEIDVSVTPAQGIQSIPGSWITAMWNGKDVRAGNPYWLRVHTHPEVDQLIGRRLTVLCVTVENRLVAAYGLESTLRSEAKAVVQDMHQRNITCHIVSGDGANVVEDVARTLGIKLHNVASGQTPSSKQNYVKDLIDQGRRVVFCGDGTNDAIAVAQAHVGVQIGSTSDITRATADVVLTGGLDGISTLLDISKQAFMRIAFNFVWSAVYNLFAILLAAGAFVKIRIPPAYAGLGEIVSVLPVILVAMSMMGHKRKVMR